VDQSVNRRHIAESSTCLPTAASAAPARWRCRGRRSRRAYGER
jgi:hypothetical protein